MFLLLVAMFDMTFCKDFLDQNFSQFYGQIKLKEGNKHPPPTENNKLMDTLQTRQTYRNAQFLGSQTFLVVYTHWFLENTIQYVSQGFSTI